MLGTTKDRKKYYEHKKAHVSHTQFNYVPAYSNKIICITLHKMSSVVHAVVLHQLQQKNKVTDFSVGLAHLKRRISARSAVTNGGQEDKNIVGSPSETGGAIVIYLCLTINCN